MANAAVPAYPHSAPSYGSQHGQPHGVPAYSMNTQHMQAQQPSLAARVSSVEAQIVERIERLYRAHVFQARARQLSNDVTTRLTDVLTALVSATSSHGGQAAAQQLQYIGQLRQTVGALERNAQQSQAAQVAQQAFFATRTPQAPSSVYQQPSRPRSQPVLARSMQQQAPVGAPASKRPRGRPKKREEDEDEELVLKEKPIDLPPRAARTRATKAQKQQILGSDEEGDDPDKDDDEYNEGQESSESEYNSDASTSTLERSKGKKKRR